MRIIGLIMMSVGLSACATSPMSPPAIMKNVATNTLPPESATFVPHKVELAGQIIKVIRNPDSVFILVEEGPLDAPSASSSMSDDQDGSPWFAITFKKAMEPSMLRAGDRLIAVGTTYQASSEVLGGAPQVLPHVMAQSLRIWNTEGDKHVRVYSDADFTGEPHPGNTLRKSEPSVLRTAQPDSASRGSHGEVKKAAGDL